MGDDKDLEEYEKEYLERIKKNEKVNPRELIAKAKFESNFEPLDPLDFVILGLFRNGISNIQTMFKRLARTSNLKIEKKINQMRQRGLLKQDENDSFLNRKFNPKFNLTDNGKQEIEKKIKELQEEWDKLVLLYEKKDKEKLRTGMEANRNFFPLMMMMGITNGMIMGNMLGMNHMMMGDFMAEVDYAYDAGYADGELGLQDGGFSDGGGDGGGFMDGGFQPGF